MKYNGYKIGPGENITDYGLICYHCENMKEYKDTEWTGHFECDKKLDMGVAIEAGDCDGFDERKHVDLKERLSEDGESE